MSAVPAPAVVVDNSFVVALVLPEVHTTLAQARLFGWDRLGTVRLAPALLAVEAASVCRKHRVSGQIPDDVTALNVLSTILSAVTVVAGDHLLAERAFEIATVIGAPRAYDALYVALAEREGCELWTGDLRLWNAAKPYFAFVRYAGEPV